MANASFDLLLCQPINFHLVFIPGPLTLVDDLLNLSLDSLYSESLQDYAFILFLDIDGHLKHFLGQVLLFVAQLQLACQVTQLVL